MLQRLPSALACALLAGGTVFAGFADGKDEFTIGPAEVMTLLREEVLVDRGREFCWVRDLDLTSGNLANLEKHLASVGPVKVVHGRKEWLVLVPLPPLLYPTDDGRPGKPEAQPLLELLVWEPAAGRDEDEDEAPPARESAPEEDAWSLSGSEDGEDPESRLLDPDLLLSPLTPLTPATPWTPPTPLVLAHPGTPPTPLVLAHAGTPPAPLDLQDGAGNAGS